MDKDNQIPIKQTNLTKSSNDFTQTRAKSFKVKAPQHNYAQYVKTVKAYALAGLPFEHIANAGEYLQDEVERSEVDAPIHQGWQKNLGEVAEDEGKILAWQNRGEVISLEYQIESPKTVTGMEVVSAIETIATPNQNQDETIEVVEGIAVFNNQTPQLPTTNNSQSSALENNPYLKAPPQDIKY